MKIKDKIKQKNNKERIGNKIKLKNKN